MVLRICVSALHTFTVSIQYFDRDFFALSLGDGPHQHTDLLDDPALPAYDLAHIAFSDADFKDRFAVEIGRASCRERVYVLV